MPKNKLPKLREFLQDHPKSSVKEIAEHLGMKETTTWAMLDKLCKNNASGLFKEEGKSANGRTCWLYSLGTSGEISAPAPAKAPKPIRKPGSATPKTAAAEPSGMESVHEAIEKFSLKVGTLIGEQVAKKVSEVVMQRFTENLNSISEEMAGRLANAMLPSLPAAKPLVMIHGLPPSQQSTVKNMFKDHLEIQFPGHVNLAEQIMSSHPQEAIVMVDMIGDDVVQGLKQTGVIYNGLKGSMTNLQKHLQEKLKH